MNDYVEILINNKPIKLNKKDAKIQAIDSVHFNIVKHTKKYNTILFDNSSETFYYSTIKNEVITLKTGFKTRTEARADLILMEQFYS